MVESRVSLARIAPNRRRGLVNRDAMVFAQMIERALTAEAESRKVSLHYHVTRIFDWRHCRRRIRR
jgi:hypothetical protein